jgi:hypothetical protein
MELDLTPEQPPAVVAAVAALLVEPRSPDPWWQAGLEEALEPDR